MCRQRIQKIFLHQVDSGLGYTMPKLTECDQLSVTEMTQILIPLASIALLSVHSSLGSQLFISVCWHRPAIPNTVQTHTGEGLEGKKQRDKEERRRKKMWGTVKKWESHSMSL